MSWKMCFSQVVEDEAEITVSVDYFEGSFGEPLWREQATFPAGTPNRTIREEMARRGRSARLALGKQKPKHELAGEISPIDDV